MILFGVVAILLARTVVLFEGCAERLVDVDVGMSAVREPWTHEGEDTAGQRDHQRLEDHEVYFVDSQPRGPTLGELNQPVDGSDKDKDNREGDDENEGDQELSLPDVCEIRVELRIAVLLVALVDPIEEEVPEELEKRDGEDLVGQATNHDVGALLGGLVDGKGACGNTTSDGLQDDGDDVADDEHERVLHRSQDGELLAVDDGQLRNDVVDSCHHETGRKGETHKLHDERIEILDVHVGPDTANVAQDLEDHSARPARQKPPLVVEDARDDLQSEEKRVHNQEGDVTADRGVVAAVVGLLVEHVEHHLGRLDRLRHQRRLDCRVCCRGGNLEDAVVLHRGLRLDDVIDQADCGDGVCHHLEGLVRRDLLRSGVC